MRGGRRDRFITFAILLVALGVRVGYVLATPGYKLLHDDHAYDLLARGVARTGAYPDVGGHATAYRPPGFPYLLAVIYRVTGTGHGRVIAGRMVQALLGVIIVALLGAIAVRLFDRRTAVCTMALTAVYVPLVAAGTSLLVEPLTIVLELGAFLAVLAWRRHENLRWVIAAGVLVGAMALCRTNAFVIIIALAVGIWPAERRPRRDAPKRVAVLLLSAAAVVLPWTIRNAVVMHSFIPVSDELGGTLAGTYNPVSAHDPNGPGFWRLYDQIPLYESETRTLASGPEVPFQDELQHLALHYVEQHPVYVLQVGFHNTLRLFGLNRLSLSRYTASLAGITSPAVADAGVYSFWVICTLALAALYRRRMRQQIPLYLWLAAGLLFVSVVFVNSEAPRLRLPIDPLILLAAGAGFMALTGAIRTSTRRSPLSR